MLRPRKLMKMCFEATYSCSSPVMHPSGSSLSKGLEATAPRKQKMITMILKFITEFELLTSLLEKNDLLSALHSLNRVCFVFNRA